MTIYRNLKLEFNQKLFGAHTPEQVLYTDVQQGERVGRTREVERKSNICKISNDTPERWTAPDVLVVQDLMVEEHTQNKYLSLTFCPGHICHICAAFIPP